MKSFSTAFVVVVLLVIARNVPGQSFYNLNFEFATITPDPSSGVYPYAVYANTAIRGWTAAGFLSPQDILYNDLTLGAPAVSLVGKADTYGPNCLDGSYSIVIYGGVGTIPPNASISQTGVVPANAQSIRFYSSGNLGAA